MNNLASGRIVADNLQYVELDPDTLRMCRLSRGDILFSRTNSYELVGKTALVTDDCDIVFASHLIRLVVDGARLLPAYLNLYLNCGPSQQRLKLLASRGVSQSNISASRLSGFSIPLPSLQEQHSIVDVINASDCKIAALEREVAVLSELFRAMLEELMSGRLAVLPLVEGEAMLAVCRREGGQSELW